MNGRLNSRVRFIVKLLVVTDSASIAVPSFRCAPNIMFKERVLRYRATGTFLYYLHLLCNAKYPFNIRIHINYEYFFWRNSTIGLGAVVLQMPIRPTPALYMYVHTQSNTSYGANVQCIALRGAAPELIGRGQSQCIIQASYRVEIKGEPAQGDNQFGGKYKSYMGLLFER